MQKLGPRQKEWLAALRSGEYTQGEGELNPIGGYCCLGVAAKVALKNDVHVEIFNDLYDDSFIVGYDLSDQPETMKYFGLKNGAGLMDQTITLNDREFKSLVDMNDNGISFEKIADVIESNPSLFFDRVV